MSPLSSAYGAVPTPRKKVWAVKVPAAPTGLMFYPLTCYAPDKAGDTVRTLDGLYGPNDKPSTQLTDQKSRCCSLTCCFYLLTVFSELSDTRLSASETRFSQDSFAFFHSRRSHSTSHPRKPFIMWSTWICWDLGPCGWPRRAPGSWNSSAV